MTSEIDEFRTSLVAAVQAELERHAAAVVAEVDRLRDESRAERDDLRADLTAQIHRLAASQQNAHLEEQLKSLKTQIDDRFAESEQRQTRRLDEVSAGIEGVVTDVAKPLVNDVRSHNEELVTRVDGLDNNLRKFDEQAARMVTYFNDVTKQMEERQDELAERVGSGVTDQVADLKRVVDENDVTVRKFQTDVSQSVTQKLNDAEDRLNGRVLAAENRLKEESGQKIADIDLHVSRVSGNLDDSLGVINERIASVDERLTEMAGQIEYLDESIKGVDQDALEDLKERMASAAGEAMLVRIEMERLEKDVSERSDSLTVRLTEVESQMQDQTMDVSTAMQLERLEEVERALTELDPGQFVRLDGADPTVAGGADTDGFSPPGQESVENDAPSADASSSPDISAIIASGEGRPSGLDSQD
jgi:hypothetical protein